MYNLFIKIFWEVCENFMENSNIYRARPITPEEAEEQRAATLHVRKYTDQRRALGQVLRCCVVTYGCQQNEADGERIAGMAREMGYEIVYSPEDADLIVVNTCAVRDHAEKKALSVTGGYKHLKMKNPELKIGVCGCMVSQPKMSEKMRKSYPYVDFVFGTEAIWRFPEILCKNIFTGKRSFTGNTGDEVISEEIPVERKSKFSAWVSIMYGCNNFCTYCIVPYVRGRERSRRPEDIIAEVRGLAAEGYKEITLLGQNVNSYGKEYGVDFSDLLSEICKIEGDFIVRFMTSHPKDVPEKLIRTIKNNPKIERHFHLPMQSGSDAILKAMNRHYDSEAYLSLARRLREEIPDIALSTDIIVGFPGESEEDFGRTLDMLEKVRFDMIFSFIYSKRDGTPAARAENQIPEEVKTERFLRMLRVQEPIADALAERNVGRTVRVLCEGKSKNNPDMLTGRDTGMKIVLFSGDETLTGKFVNIKITDAHAFGMTGVITE